MKKTVLFITIAVAGLYAACTKTTNNTTVTGPATPAFTVSGIHEIDFVNNGIETASMPLTIQYGDSAQENVTLSLSALPAGIAMDTGWLTNGIPTFSTQITLYDTTQAGATLGTFPMTLTAKGAFTGTKTFSFNIKVTPQPPCTSFLVGKYTNCFDGCTTSSSYTDSVYADPNVTNRIWFTNLGGMGIKIYGNYNCSSEQITIPSQTVGSVTYSGSGEGYYGSSSKTIFLDLFNGTTTCSVNMN
jgi:hypothetical protein